MRTIEYNGNGINLVSSLSQDTEENLQKVKNLKRCLSVKKKATHNILLSQISLKIELDGLPRKKNLQANAFQFSIFFSLKLILVHFRIKYNF